ncbi:MAG: hypothetical protein N2C14_21020 [Planctomycetales bacterium]
MITLRIPEPVLVLVIWMGAFAALLHFKPETLETPLVLEYSTQVGAPVYWFCIGAAAVLGLPVLFFYIHIRTIVVQAWDDGEWASPGYFWNVTESHPRLWYSKWFSWLGFVYIGSIVGFVIFLITSGPA